MSLVVRAPSPETPSPSPPEAGPAGPARPRGRGVRRAALAVATPCALWLGGLIWFAETIPREPPPATGPAAEHLTDAVVVLTGGSERLEAGLELLAAGRARKLFVSGVHHGVDMRDLLRRTHQKPTEAECCVVLGYAADNTLGNAAETAAWMRAEHFTSLRLVTANYHLRRSLLEFRMAIPEAEVVPHPVIPANVRVADWWLWRRTTGLIVTEYNKYLLALSRYVRTAALTVLERP